MPGFDRGRFSVKRKRETVLRLPRGEDLDRVSREVGVNGSTLASRREAFLEGELGALRSLQRDERIDEMERKIGQVTMNNELLYKKIERMEGGVPLGRRWSRR